MALVKLDDEIIRKLTKTFSVKKDEVDETLNFFNEKLKPEIKAHYLSHLVASIEEMINEQEKKNFFAYIKKTAQTEKDINTLANLISEKRVRLFTIILQPINSTKRKAHSYKKSGGIMIYYADYLQENEKRFVIAHELGHVVNEYLFKGKGSQAEGRASLFAYIALLDKNNFYLKECKDYVLKTDIELFNEYKNLMSLS